MIKRLPGLLLIGLTAVTLNVSAQYRKIHTEGHAIPFSKDSLIGFEEQSFRNQALEHGVSAEETELYIQVSKREFIKKKYNLFPPVDPSLLNKVATPACTNEDFEDFSFTYSIPNTVTITTTNGITGWLSTRTVVSSANSSCIIPTLAATAAPNAISVIAPGPGGHIDALIGPSYPIHSVFGYFPNSGGVTGSGDTMRGEWFVKINQQAGNADLHRIKKSINITASNALFKFGFIALVEGSHCCCDSPGFDLTFKDCSNNVLPIGSYTLAPPAAAACTPSGNCVSPAVTASMMPAPMNANWRYNKWNVNSVDLSAYIGTCVTIEVTSVDCPYAGHGGYCYFDAQCGPSLTTGIASIKNSAASISLYPNPNTGEFTLSVDQGLDKGEVLIENMLGQVVFRQSISQGENKILANNLAQGVYNYSVKENKTTIGKGKLVVE
jgi:hypothetical protein